MVDVELSEVEAEFEGTELGDKRLDARLVMLARSMAAEPALSFPRALSTAELEAAYRFLSNVRVTPQAMLQPHIRQTLSRISEQAVVLVAHDSSTISFTSDGSREGLASGGGQVTDLESVPRRGPEKPDPVPRPGPDPTAPSNQTELSPQLRDQ
jgi:hypothetical protein